MFKLKTVLLLLTTTFLFVENGDGGIIIKTVRTGICKGREALHTLGNLIMPHNHNINCEDITQKQTEKHTQENEKLASNSIAKENESYEVSSTLPPIDIRADMNGTEEQVTVDSRFLTDVGCKSGMKKARDGTCRAIA